MKRRLFVNLLDLYAEKVYYKMYKSVQNKASAEHLTQLCFIELWRSSLNVSAFGARKTLVYIVNDLKTKQSIG